jgi:hypothetical protein
MPTTNDSNRSRKFIVPALLAVGAVIAVAGYFGFEREQAGSGIEVRSDPTALDLIGWGESQQQLRSLYTGAGTTIAALGYRDIGSITGCDGIDSEAVRRRAHTFATASIDGQQCEVTIDSLLRAEESDHTACLAAIETAVNAWELDWNPAEAGEAVYEFQNVYSPAGKTGDVVVTLHDKVHTIERLAGWPIGDPVSGFENSRTVWNQDYAGWSPANDDASCPVVWAQCFDRKQPLYKGVPGLDTLGDAEGLCVIELSPDLRNGIARHAIFNIVHDVAPDTKVVVASFAKNREDSMSRAADWLIQNQSRFNIVAARTSNVVYLETSLLSTGLQELCGEADWCDEAAHVPYNNVCAGDPYAGGNAYAYKSVVQLPQNYQPIAYQYERMRDAGIVAVKGAGHEGWKGALPYPDCSPALLSVGVVYAGTNPRTAKPEKLAEGGWIAQGWRWDPSSYCEEKTITRDQVSCVTNNSPDLGYGLSTGETVSPLMAAHPMESVSENLGNAWVTPYVIAAVAVIKSDNLAPGLSAPQVIDLIHRNGDEVWDRRKCDQNPETDEPDGWLRAGFSFFDMELASPDDSASPLLSERELQLLEHPWGYSCSDAISADTAPFHTDNVADYSNRRLNIGAAVNDLLNAAPD